MTSYTRAEALESALKIATPGMHPWELIENAKMIEHYIYSEKKETPPSSLLPENKISKNAFFENNEKKFERLYDHQKMILEALSKKDKLLIVSSRQMGITSLIQYFIHETVLSNIINVRVLTNKSNMKTYTDFFEINSATKILDNGSTITIEAFDNYKAPQKNREKSKSKKETVLRSMLIIDGADLIPYAYEGNISPIIQDADSAFLFGNAGGGLFRQLWFQSSYWEESYGQIMLPWYIHPDREDNWGASVSQLMGEEAFMALYECKWPPVKD